MWVGAVEEVAQVDVVGELVLLPRRQAVMSWRCVRSSCNRWHGEAGVEGQREEGAVAGLLLVGRLVEGPLAGRKRRALATSGREPTRSSMLPEATDKAGGVMMMGPENVRWL
jgi:hypothetical protein